MIPAAAVEAAAYALHLDAHPDTEVQWFDIGFQEQDELMRTATKLLEAAAPHMLAELWDEGYSSGRSGGWPDDNPYRPAP